MIKAFKEVYGLAAEYKVPMRVAAYIAALRRLAVAMKFRGMYWFELCADLWYVLIYWKMCTYLYYPICTTQDRLMPYQRSGACFTVRLRICLYIRPAYLRTYLIWLLAYLLTCLSTCQSVFSFCVVKYTKWSERMCLFTIIVFSKRKRVRFRWHWQSQVIKFLISRKQW